MKFLELKRLNHEVSPWTTQITIPNFKEGHSFCMNLDYIKIRELCEVKFKNGTATRIYTNKKDEIFVLETISEIVEKINKICQVAE